MPKFSWTDVEDIAYELQQKFAGRDPYTIPFPELRDMIEGLEDFEPLERQSVNEKILEAVQTAWAEEKELDEED